MKKRDFLNIFGDIDDELIEDAAPSFEKKSVPAKNKRKTSWMKYAAIAACCVLILSGVMISGHLFDVINNPDVGESSQAGGDGNQSGDVNFPVETDGRDDEIKLPQEEWTEDQEFPGDYAETDLNDEMTFEEEPNEEMPEPDLYYELKREIKDEKYADYYLDGLICDEDMVGDRIETVEVELYYTNDPDNKCTLNADIFKVEGADESWFLCYRFEDTDDVDLGDFYQDHTRYYFLVNNDIEFDSFEELKEKLSPLEPKCGKLVSFSWRENGKNFFVNVDVDAELSGRITDTVLGLKGDFVEWSSEFYERLFNECGERIYVPFSTKATIGFFYVFDTGYISFYLTSPKIFYIGEEAAAEISELIKTSGEPLGYIWNAEESKWVKITDKNVQASDYACFKAAIDGNILDDTLTFDNRVGYWEDYWGFSPKGLTVSDNIIGAFAEILYISDGDRVEVAEGEIEKLADESVSLKHIGADGSSFVIELYDNGYARIGNAYYDIGEEYTIKIINTVRTEGDTKSTIYWNDNDECWQTYGPDEEEKVEKDETSPAESVDYGYESDVHEEER